MLVHVSPLSLCQTNIMLTGKKRRRRKRSKPLSRATSLFARRRGHEARGPFFLSSISWISMPRAEKGERIVFCFVLFFLLLLAVQLLRKTINPRPVMTDRGQPEGGGLMRQELQDLEGQPKRPTEFSTPFQKMDGWMDG